MVLGLMIGEFQFRDLAVVLEEVSLESTGISLLPFVLLSIYGCQGKHAEVAFKLEVNCDLKIG